MLSPKLNVYSIEWLNVVFANRNQSYGAYELRKNYNWRLAKALMIASTLVIGGVSAPLIYKYLSPEVIVKDPFVELNDLPDLDKVIDVNIAPKKIEPIKPAGGAAAAPKVKIVQLPSNIQVTPAEQIVVDPPTQDELQNAVVGSVNQDGPTTTGNIPGLATNGQNGVGPSLNEGTGTSDESENIVIAGNLEHQPEFPGGMDAFANFLRKNLRYPEFAAENGASGRVYVNFVVEKDGSLTDVKVTRGIGFGCDEEAMRVLKKSPKWSAGEQNGRKVRVMYTVPIVFSIGE